MTHGKRLCAGAAEFSSCGVAHMSHSDIFLTETCKSILAKNLVNKSQVLVAGEHTPVVDNFPQDSLPLYCKAHRPI